MLKNSSRCLLVVSFWFLTAQVEAQVSFSDNFNDGQLDPSRYHYFSNTAGFTETNGVLSYFTLEGASANEFENEASSIWRFKSPAFTNEWSAQLDVNIHLSEWNIQTQQFAWIGLQVANIGRLSEYGHLDMGVGSSRTAPRKFYSEIWSRGIDFNFRTNIQSARTTLASGSIRIQWDAFWRVLSFFYDTNGVSGGYNWVNLASWTLGQRPFTWSMNETSRFRVTIVASSRRLDLGPGFVTADNFALETTGVPLPPLKISRIMPKGDAVLIEWEAGRGPYQLQRRSKLGIDLWEDSGASQTKMSMEAPMDVISGFFRIRDLGAGP